jgi:prepilin-type N-terminal cleavage/methylation domain-containing protein
MTQRRHGFSLMEVLMAIFILGIGVIGIAALFPAGIAQQRASVDDVIGPTVADNAIALLRSRLEPGDFGTFEEFNQYAPYAPTVPGDWPWLRPGFCLDDDTTTQSFAGTAYDERGAYDIFSYHYTRAMLSLGSNVAEATELPNGPYDTGVVPFGIPYNWDKYDFLPATTNKPEPRFIVTQQERYYPMVSDADVPAFGPQNAQGKRSRPLYVWDCMFRRYQGRVYVAIFVYRITPRGGDRTDYVTPPNPLTSPAPPNPPDPIYPPLPYRLDLTHGNPPPWPDAWDAYGINRNDPLDDALVRGTPSGGTWNLRDPEAAWQQYAQWLLDQNNNVHRVLSRQPETTTTSALVELLRPLVPVTSFDQAVSFVDRSPGVDWGVENIVTHLWYIPVEVDLDVDGNGTPDAGASVGLTTVYVTVREL